MLNQFLMKRLLALRQRLFACIEFENKMGNDSLLSIEGETVISYRFPGISKPVLKFVWSIQISSCLLCEGSGEDFYGATFEECLDQFEKFIEGCEKGQAEIRERGIV